jgi:hypothetical protein
MYLIQILFFCGSKLDLRQYITYSSHIKQWENRSTCCPLNLYSSGHCLMASEFYSGKLTFSSNLPRGQVVNKVKLHLWHFRNVHTLSYQEATGSKGIYACHFIHTKTVPLQWLPLLLDFWGDVSGGAHLPWDHFASLLKSHIPPFEKGSIDRSK